MSTTTFAIPPTTSLTGLAAVSPAAFQLLTTGTSATSTSVFDSASSIVEVSTLGQLLGAGSTLENTLQALQSNPATATAASVVTEAQDFVSAFNSAQQSIGNVQPLLDALPDSTLVDQFAVTLNTAASTGASSGTSGLGSLQSIGITLSAIPNPGALLTAGLSIDQNALNAAAASNPGGTLTLLAQATQPLLQQVATFEAQATTTAVAPTDLTLQGTTIPTNLLQNLSADTVLNNIQLNNLDLASLGLDANTLQSTGTALDNSLSATLTPTDTGTLATEQLLLPANTLLSATGTTTATTHAADVLATLTALPNATGDTTSTTATPTTAGTTATLSAVTTATVTTATVSASVTDAQAAEQAVSTATLNLQNLINDPTLRAINNNLFDPLYSALIAASHQNDFTSPMPMIRANALLEDIPAPVIAAAQVQAISDYNQMASGSGRRQFERSS